MHQINNVLYQNRTHLRGAFRMLDTAGTGKISARAFEHTLRNINAHLDPGSQLSDLQIRELRRCLDRAGRGVVDYEDFFDGLGITDTRGGDVLPRHSSAEAMVDDLEEI